ncbi:MAG TPA: carboxymuconolactone decarboxylase family protein [Acidimicrobiia bacterium]
MIRPYAAMLHRPELARAAADLGAVIRFQSTLSDHDRELAIVTTAVERDCAFEWNSHRPLAVEAGVSEATLEAVADGGAVTDSDDSGIVELVRMLCRSDAGGGSVYDTVLDRFGETGLVELSVLVGYYSMMAVFMKACDAC